MTNRERLEARQWVQKAVALYRSSGRDETLARIGDNRGPFVEVEGGRYIFALDLEGNLLAHPYSKQFVGQNMAGLRDSEGRTFVRKVITTALRRGYGYADYRWPHPDTKEELKKTVFFERVDGIVLCSGFYSPVEEAPVQFTP